MLDLLRPAVLATLFRTYGPDGLARRALHEWRRRSGRYRRTTRWPVAPLDGAGRRDTGAIDTGDAFRIDFAAVRRATDPAAALARADRVASGEHQAFRWRWQPLPTGSAWSSHPTTGRAHRSDAPWWTIDLLDASVGDVKDIWEPGRFGWVYDLIRGYAVSGDARYAAAFLERLADWRAANPTFLGVQWACGQETAIRAVAVLYAEANLPGCADHPDVLWLLGASGERIRDAIGYARSQRNNHALSEAVGLLALGHRLAGRHPEAAEWFRLGDRLIPELVASQFAPDGWYIQHSFTYLRLAVEQCLVAGRVLRAVGRDLEPVVRARLAAAMDLIDAVIDPATGIVPNHGPNDGAFVHPTTLAEYRDFRPLLTALAGQLGQPLAADIAPDQETLAWLGRPLPAAGPARAGGVRVGGSGWVAARQGGTFAFLRAGHYQSRPGHFDPLHLDVRLDSAEVVVDPGTFRYGGSPPWRNGLAGPAVHNGPVLDAAPVKGPRFLWIRWPNARIVGAVDRGPETVIEAEIPGRVRREVRVTAESVEIVDRSVGGDGGLRQTWLLHPDASPSWLAAEDGVWSEAAEDDPRGWFSPRYGERVASRFVTVVRERPGDAARVEIRRRGAR